MSRSNVSSVEIEIRSTWVSSPRSSIPRARSRSSEPTLPGSRRRSASSSSAARSPIVATPAARRRSSARGPTPGRRRTSNGARNDGLLARAHDGEPAGLAPVGGDLGDDLAGGDAERAGERARPAHGGLDRLGELAGGEEVRRDLAEVEVALVDPGLLDRGDDLADGAARPSASTGGRGCGAAGRRPPPGSAAAPRRSSSPSGSRSAARRSSRSRRPRARAGRRRRRAACGAGSDPRAARRRRRRRPGRGARRSREQAYARVSDTRGVRHCCYRRDMASVDVPVALLGYGTVGSAVDRLLRDQAADIERATGHRLRVVRALVRDPAKKRERRRRRPRPTSPRSATTPRSRSSPR